MRKTETPASKNQRQYGKNQNDHTDSKEIPARQKMTPLNNAAAETTRIQCLIFTAEKVRIT